MSIAAPLLLPWTPKLLCGPQGQSHPLVVNHTLQLAAWHVCANPCKREEFQETLPSSSWQLGGRVQTQFITPPRTNGIASVTSGKLIRFVPLWQIQRLFLPIPLTKGSNIEQLILIALLCRVFCRLLKVFPVGQHPLVVYLLKGILNFRPALPRYQQAWDVNVALEFLRSLPANEALPLSTLSKVGTFTCPHCSEALFGTQDAGSSFYAFSP